MWRSRRGLGQASGVLILVFRGRPVVEHSEPAAAVTVAGLRPAEGQRCQTHSVQSPEVGIETAMTGRLDQRVERLVADFDAYLASVPAGWWPVPASASIRAVRQA